MAATQYWRTSYFCLRALRRRRLLSRRVNPTARESLKRTFATAIDSAIGRVQLDQCNRIGQ